MRWWFHASIVAWFLISTVQVSHEFKFESDSKHSTLGTRHLCNSVWVFSFISFLLYVMDLINSRLVQMQLHLKFWNSSRTFFFFSLYDVNWFFVKNWEISFLQQLAGFASWLKFIHLLSFGFPIVVWCFVCNWKTQLNQRMKWEKTQNFTLSSLLDMFRMQK